jgi:hypothetical protein
MAEIHHLVDSEGGWSDEAKAAWLGEHGGTPTHIVSFRPEYTLEVCVPPWETAATKIARAGVTWGADLRVVLATDSQNGMEIVAVHNEGNMLTHHKAVPPPRRLMGSA